MGETRRRGARRRSPTWPRSASTSSPSASTCAPPTDHLPVARWVDAGGRSTAWRRVGEAPRHRPRRGVAAHPVEPPRQGVRRRRTGRSAPCHNGLMGAPDGQGRSSLTATSWVDRAPARVLRRHGAVGRRRPREPLTQGPRHLPGARRRRPSPTSTSPGAGAETIAHLRQNGRITFMFCAFEGPPRILRLFGCGRGACVPGDPDCDELAGRVPGAARARGRSSGSRLERVADVLRLRGPRDGLRRPSATALVSTGPSRQGA